MGNMQYAPLTWGWTPLHTTYISSDQERITDKLN